MKTKKHNQQLNLITESILKIISETDKLDKHSELSEKLLSLIKELELRKFRAFEKLSFPVVVLSFTQSNRIGKIVFANESFLKFTGEKFEDVINSKISKFIKKKENKDNLFFNENIWGKLSRRKKIVFNINFSLKYEKRKVEITSILYEFLDESYIVFLLWDIEKEERLLNLLLEEKQRYKYFFENTDSSVYRVEFPKPISTKLPLKKQAKLIFETGVVVECNTRFAENMGFGEPESIIGRSVPEVFGALENLRNDILSKKFIKNNYKVKGEVVKQITLKGEVGYFSLYIFGYVKNDLLYEVWGAYYDITELEVVKINLEKSRNELASMFNNSPIALALLDENLKTVMFNRVLKETFGYTEKDLPDLESWFSGPLNLLDQSKSDVKKWLVSARKLREKKIDVVQKETLIKTKSGEIKNTIVSLSFVEDKFLVSITDISDLYKAKVEAERAKQIIEKSPILLFQWELKNNRFKLIYVTKNISKLGYKKNDFIGHVSEFKKILNNSNRVLVERKNAVNEGKKFLKQSIGILTADKQFKFYDSYITIVYEKDKVLLWEILSDVTEKHLTELKLLESMEQYRSVFENSPVGIFRFDNVGNIVSFNSRFLEIFGTTPKKVLQINMVEHIQNDSVKKVAVKALKGKAGSYEGPYTSIVSGKEVYIRFLAQPIFDEKKKVTSVIGLVEDISERRKAQEELEKTRDAFKQTAEQLDFILNHLNDIVYEQRLDRRIIYVSGSVKRVLGYSPKEFIQKRKQILTDNPINKKIGKNLSIVFNKRKSVRYNVEIFAKNGKKVLLEVNESPIITKGKVIGLIGVARNVTENFRQNMLREALYAISSETLNAQTLPQLYKFIHKIVSRFMAADNFFIAVWDKKENLIKFEYYVDEIDSENPGSLVPKNGFTEYAIKSKMSAILFKEDIQKLLNEGEFDLIGTLPESIAVVYLHFTNGNEGVIVLQDYYDRDAYCKEDLEFLKIVSTQIVQSIEKKLAEEEIIKTNRLLRKREKELQKQTEELQLSNANKDRLFSIIAHDLRSPFTALLGLTNMLNEMIDEFSFEEIKEMVASLDDSARGLYKLLENLLNWSRLQLGTFKIRPKKINLNYIALNVKEYLNNSAKQKNIKISVEMEPEIYAFADVDTVETIIRNLVNNSIKFTNPGGKIKIKAEKSNDKFVQVTVEDNGIGMSEEILNNLFKIDKKVSRPGTNSEPGTGLGLILVKELVEKNNGSIKVESKENVGSKFIFTLPIS